MVNLQQAAPATTCSPVFLYSAHKSMPGSRGVDLSHLCQEHCFGRQLSAFGSSTQFLEVKTTCKPWQVMLTQLDSHRCGMSCQRGTPSKLCRSTCCSPIFMLWPDTGVRETLAHPEASKLNNASSKVSDLQHILHEWSCSSCQGAGVTQPKGIASVRR